jgi:hypothetical protein
MHHQSQQVIYPIPHPTNQRNTNDGSEREIENVEMGQNYPELSIPIVGRN